MTRLVKSYVDYINFENYLSYKNFEGYCSLKMAENEMTTLVWYEVFVDFNEFDILVAHNGKMTFELITENKKNNL